MCVCVVYYYQISELKEKLTLKDHLYEMVGKTANVYILCCCVFLVYLIGERDSYRGNTIENWGCLFIYMFGHMLNRIL